MKKRLWVLLTAVILLLTGCGPQRDVTKIFPVKDYVVTKDGITATFEMNGEIQKFDFDNMYIYPCDEESRIIGIGKENANGEVIRGLYLYLYLDEEDYAEYTRESNGLSDDFMKEQH